MSSGNYSYNSRSNPGNAAPYSQVSQPRHRRQEIDVHQLLRQEMRNQIGAQESNSGGVLPGSASSSNDTYVGPYTDLKYGVSDQYIYFDSTDKVEDSDFTQGKVVFNLQETNRNQPISNVIEMQIVDFSMPEIPRPATHPQYFFFQRLMVRIEEMNAQSILAKSNTTRFHFEMGMSPAGISNRVFSLDESNKFVFTAPFKEISTLTLQFMAPSFKGFKNVQLPLDVMTFKAVPLVAGGVFGGGTITTDVPHGLTTGDDVTIYIADFRSNIANIDSNIGSPQYLDGHLMRVVNANTLEFRAAADVGFDFTTLAVATPGTLLVGYRRIAFTIRFRSLLPKETNQITPV